MSPEAGINRYVVARAGDIAEGSRVIVSVRGRSVGIFNVAGRFYAVLNRCPHMGAELCRGIVTPMLESVEPGAVSFDESRPILQCPWHRWEFDLLTGRSVVDPNGTRVRAYALTVDEGAEISEAVRGNTATTEEVGAQAFYSQTEGHLVTGPYTAETYPVTVEDDYIVLDLGTSRKPPAAAKASAGPGAEAAGQR